MNAFVKFARLTPAERALLMHAALLLAGIRVALWLLPYFLLRRLLRTGHEGSAEKSGSSTPGRIAWAVRVASRLVPAATCLTQSLAPPPGFENPGVGRARAPPPPPGVFLGRPSRRGPPKPRGMVPLRASAGRLQFCPLARPG